MTIDLTFPALYALRDNLATINGQISGHLADMQRIRSAPPHANDIASQFRRGLDSAASEYEARLASHFADPHASDTLLVAGEGIAAYFMRDLVAAKIPDLIKKLCPSAERGMPDSERRRRIQEVSGQLDQLAAEREALRQAFTTQKYELSQQRQAARHAGHHQATYAIEREERTLREDLDALAAAQHELQQRRFNGPSRA